MRSRTGGVLSGPIAVLVCWMASGCAPRQATVQSDPRGGEAVRLQLEERVRADLAALRTAQTEFRTATGRYGHEPRELDYVPSPGVQIDILEATADGFSALGRSGTVECALFMGSADPPRAYARVSSEIACRP